MKKLAGKVAIVTGASKGIGAAAAKALAAEGAAVAVNYSSGKQGAERVVSQITREDGKAIAIQADVSKALDVKRLFEETSSSLWRPLQKKNSIASLTLMSWAKSSLSRKL